MLWWASWLVAALLCRPAAPPPPSAYLLRYRFTAGRGLHYAVETDVTAMRRGTVATGPVHHHDTVEAVVRVDAVAPDGSANVVASHLVIAGGWFLPELDRLSAPRRVTPLGAMVAEGAARGKQFVPSLLTELFMPLPVEPVRVGVAWPTRVPDISGDGIGQRTVACRLVRVEREGARHIAVLARAYTQPVGLTRYGGMKVSGQVSVNEEVRLAVETGQVAYRRATAEGRLTTTDPHWQEADEARSVQVTQYCAVMTFRLLSATPARKPPAARNPHSTRKAAHGR